MPELKVIMILRNPVDRAWSAAKMHLCTLSEKRFEDISRDDFIKHFRSAHSLGRSDYVAIYKLYSKYFGEDNVMVDFYERVAEEPVSLLQSFADFLKIDKGPIGSLANLDKPVANAEYANEIPGDLFDVLLEIYTPVIKEQGDFFGSCCSSWMKNLLSDSKGSGS